MESTLIAELLEQLGCNYAFFFKPAAADALYLANAGRFRSASLIKVPILLAWLQLERLGEVDRREECDLDREPQVHGAGFAWKFAARRLPYHDLLLMMIATSDNLCTNLVIARAGMERLNAIFHDTLGLPETILQRKLMDFEARQRGLDNWIGAQDCIRLYDLLDALPPAERAWVDGLLLANTDNALLLRNLERDGVDFFHKTGSVSGVLHDWGYTPEKRLFLLLNNVPSELAAFSAFGKLGELLI